MLIQPPVSYGYSIARAASGATPTAVTGAGNSFSTGIAFNTIAACLCIGVRFYAVLTGSKSYKCSVWDQTSTTRLANVTVTQSTTGLYEAIFSSGVSLTAGQFCRATIWQTDGLGYQRTVKSAMVAILPTGTRLWTGNYSMGLADVFGTGDAYPNTSAAAEGYAVEPILLIP